MFSAKYDNSLMDVGNNFTNISSHNDFNYMNNFMENGKPNNNFTKVNQSKPHYENIHHNIEKPNDLYLNNNNMKIPEKQKEENLYLIQNLKEQQSYNNYQNTQNPYQGTNNPFNNPINNTILRPNNIQQNTYMYGNYNTRYGSLPLYNQISNLNGTQNMNSQINQNLYNVQLQGQMLENNDKFIVNNTFPKYQQLNQGGINRIVPNSPNPLIQQSLNPHFYHNIYVNPNSSLNHMNQIPNTNSLMYNQQHINNNNNHFNNNLQNYPYSNQIQNTDKEQNIKTVNNLDISNKNKLTTQKESAPNSIIDILKNKNYNINIPKIAFRISAAEVIDKELYLEELDNNLFNILFLKQGSWMIQNNLEKFTEEVIGLMNAKLIPLFSHLIKNSYANYPCQILYDKGTFKDKENIIDCILRNLESLILNDVSMRAVYSIFESVKDTILQQKIILKIQKLLSHKKIYNQCYLKIMEPVIDYERKHLNQIENFILNNLYKLLNIRQGYFICKKFVLNVKDFETQMKIIYYYIKKFDIYPFMLNGSLIAQCIFRNFSLIEVSEFENYFKETYIFLNANRESLPYIKNSSKKENVQQRNYIDIDNFINPIKENYPIVSTKFQDYEQEENENQEELNKKKYSDDYFKNKHIAKSISTYNKRYYKIIDSPIVVMFFHMVVDNIAGLRHNKNSYKLMNSMINLGGDKFINIIMDKLNLFEFFYSPDYQLELKSNMSNKNNQMKNEVKFKEENNKLEISSKGSNSNFLNDISGTSFENYKPFDESIYNSHKIENFLLTRFLTSGEYNTLIFNELLQNIDSKNLIKINNMIKTYIREVDNSNKNKSMYYEINEIRYMKLDIQYLIEKTKIKEGKVKDIINTTTSYNYKNYETYENLERNEKELQEINNHNETESSNLNSNFNSKQKFPKNKKNPNNFSTKSKYNHNKFPKNQKAYNSTNIYNQKQPENYDDNNFEYPKYSNIDENEHFNLKETNQTSKSNPNNRSKFVSKNHKRKINKYNY